MVVFNDLFNESFLILGPLGPASSFIIIGIVIFIRIDMIVGIVILLLIFHLALVFMPMASRVLALIILRVPTLVRRVRRAIILLVRILSLNFVIPQILLHELVDHRVVVLDRDEVFAAVFDALDFNLLDHLLLEDCGCLLGLEYDVLVVSALLLDDRA